MALPAGVHPTKIVAVHVGYRSRAAQRGRWPAHPSYFLKPPSTLGSDGDPVVRPAGCELLAFEGEIALIMGSRAKEVTPEEAWGHVGWVSAANDFGVYDLRYADSGSNVRSKGIDGYTPLGPRLLDARDLSSRDLRLRTWVDGELVQDADTASDLLFPFEVMVADLSRLMTLEPGDIVLTGTPSGSSVVEPGSLVEVEVSTAAGGTTGRLRTPIAQAARPLAALGAMPKGGGDPQLRALAYGAPADQGGGAASPGRGTAGDGIGRAGRTGEVIGVAGRTGEVAAQGGGGDLVAGFRRVATATVASQLRKLGYDGLTMDGLVPARPELRLVGRARTLQYLPLREDLFAARGGGYNAQKRIVDELHPGEVLVIGARGELGAGTIGDLLALRAQVRGAAGIVTDGAVRDSVALARLDVPTYHGGVHPAVLGRRHVPWAADVPVACGGVLVLPGDLLVGDADGVVLVPDQLAAQVLEGALEQERQEAFIAEQVAAGSPVEGLYPIGPAWADAYARWCAAQDRTAAGPDRTAEEGARG